MSQGALPRNSVVSSLQPLAIWKKIIERKPEEEETEVAVAGLVRILSVGVQAGKIVLWYEANPKADTQTLQFQIRGGHQLFGNEGSFLGTCQLGRSAVVHVYFKYLG